MIREFARSGWGQETLSMIEEFGLPGVDSAADVTEVQSMFIHMARIERENMKRNKMPSA